MRLSGKGETPSSSISTNLLGRALSRSLLYSLQVGLLAVNSVMILNKERFLAKHGLDDIVVASHDPVKSQIVGLLHAIQYLKIPVIAANVVTIVFEIFFGG